MKTAIVNIGQIVSGDWKSPFEPGDAILCEDGLIQSVGTLSAQDVSSADVVIDADGATAIPGLIDSHVHITFGDYTPRQKTVGYLESYLHGGVTTAISASEVHVPGRPKDPIGVKALAVAAARCFKTYRPGGMRVHAGSVILEPGLNESDFAELRNHGRLARQGRFRRIRNALRLCRAGRLGQAGGHDHDDAHRRFVHSGLVRHLGGSSSCRAATCLVPCERRPRRDARQRIFPVLSRNPRSRCKSAPREICARHCSLPISRAKRMPSTAC